MSVFLTLLIVDILTWILLFVLLGVFLSNTIYTLIAGYLLNYTIHLLTTLRIIYVLEEGYIFTWWTFATFAFCFVFDIFTVLYTGLRAPRDNWSWGAVLAVGISFAIVTLCSLFMSTTFSPRPRHSSTRRQPK